MLILTNSKPLPHDRDLVALPLNSVRGSAYKLWNKIGKIRCIQPHEHRCSDCGSVVKTPRSGKAMVMLFS